jgi:hypothetical protein
LVGRKPSRGGEVEVVVVWERRLLRRGCEITVMAIETAISAIKRIISRLAAIG